MADTADDTTIGDCGNCDGRNACYWVDDYIIYHECPDCGDTGEDAVEDVHGCMSVPWGYLL